MRSKQSCKHNVCRTHARKVDPGISRVCCTPKQDGRQRLGSRKPHDIYRADAENGASKCIRGESTKCAQVRILGFELVRSKSEATTREACYPQTLNSLKRRCAQGGLALGLAEEEAAPGSFLLEADACRLRTLSALRRDAVGPLMPNGKVTAASAHAAANCKPCPTAWGTNAAKAPAPC